jgi:hypothetical protein
MIEIPSNSLEHPQRIHWSTHDDGDHRAELIQILTMSEFTQDMIVQKKTLAELRKEAQEKKLPGIWKLRRSELVELLYLGSKQNNQNDNSGKEHNQPQKGESNKIGVDMLKDTIENRA